MTDRPSWPALAPADIEWLDGQPFSRNFNDVYYSRDDGLAESQHVFINANDLPRRFRELGPGEHFTVAEAGFGTGLNFLVTWLAWRESGPAAGAVLHFVSVESHPLTPQDLQRALTAWPELAPLADQLLAGYPELVDGLHRLSFDQGQVRLSLAFGDAHTWWQTMEFRAHAWYLDGFSPARNPELWDAATARAVALHCHEGATLATFTSVGQVRRDLAEAGFRMRRLPGFGRKRPMLAGEVSRANAPADSSKAPDSATVIGSGIAGATLARALAERGVAVTVLEQGAAPASGASGNRQGALYVKLGVDPGPETRLALASLLYARRYYQQFLNAGWYPTGLLQMAWSDQEADRQRRFIERNDYPRTLLRPVSAGQARELTGAQVPHGGLWFPENGWLEPARICASLLNHPGISVKTASTADTMIKVADEWQVLDTAGNVLAQSSAVVICAGHLSPALLPDGRQYRLKPIRGQVTSITGAALDAPRAVVCADRYLNPASKGQCLAGATFDLNDTDPAPRTDSDRENLDAVARLTGRGQSLPPEAVADHRVAFRCTTHDYQPVLGPLPPEGLFAFTGLGSKGLSYAPLLAEQLADALCQQPHSLPRNLAIRLNPLRCLRAD